MAAYDWLGPVRAPFRRAFYRVLAHAFRAEDGRRILADSTVGTLPSFAAQLDLPNRATQPYGDLGRCVSSSGEGPPPVFITGRFRSGSTLLWNLFRNVPGCTAFYEPLNERRWFDPAVRGDRIDKTHLGVSDYWREYEGLAHLGQWYRQDWIDRQLYMDEASWDPDLHSYVRGLIEAAPQRAVLQFNRVDFRLAWLRQNFPGARLIHLYRHPRDQWCSSLVDPGSFPRDGSVQSFDPHDHFYLLAWARDLSYTFPFLDPRGAKHPYDLFYLIWKLSYLLGRRHADASFSFESLCDSPDVELPRLMRSAGIEVYELSVLKPLIVPQKTKWHRYAAQDWFAAREAECEEVLARFFTSTKPAAAIQ
jgi:hypothetical protein